MPPINTNRRREISATIALIICIVISMGLLTLWSTEGEGGLLHGTRGVVSTVAAPLQRIGSILAIPFQAIGNAATNASASTEELLTLEQENEQLYAQVAELQEYKLENERLARLLDMKDAYAFNATGARVISQSADSWNRTLTIDKGAIDGIAVGMPVMSGDGLLGQVESVAPLTSVVRLITDDTGGVSVLLQNSRVEGILSGSVDGLLYVEYVPISTPVQLGEPVVTSGLGGVFPKGLVVGAVTRIDGKSTDTYHTILVQPLATVGINEEVLVVTGSPTEVFYDPNAAGTSRAAAEAENQETGDAAAEGTEGAATEGTAAEHVPTEGKAAEAEENAAATTAGDTERQAAEGRAD